MKRASQNFHAIMLRLLSLYSRYIFSQQYTDALTGVKSGARLLSDA